MGKSIKGRIEKIEDALHLQRKPNPRVLVIRRPLEPELEKMLPENVEEWLTYQQKIRKCLDTTFVMLISTDELYARGLIKNEL